MSEPQRPLHEPPSPESLADLARIQRALRPGFFAAVAGDARQFSYHRGDRRKFASLWAKWLNVLRLMWVADDFFGVFLYRLRTTLHSAGVPILPRLLHFADVTLFNIRIGDQVVIGEGVYIPHGNVAIYGITRVGRRCYFGPFGGLGVVPGNAKGPTLEDGVFLGAGAKVLGDVHVGPKTIIGANAIVVKDINAKSMSRLRGAKSQRIEGSETANA